MSNYLKFVVNQKKEGFNFEISLRDENGKDKVLESGCAATFHMVVDFLLKALVKHLTSNWLADTEATVTKICTTLDSEQESEQE